MKRVALLFAVLVLLAAMAGFAQAQMLLKYGHVAPNNLGHHKGALTMAEYVKEKTNGEIQIDVFPLGQLGGERSMLEQVQAGTLDIADATNGVMSNYVPQALIFDLFFLFPSREVAWKVHDDEEVRKIFNDLFPAKGFVAIGTFENEMRDLTNSVREVKTPNDMEGLKLRVIESPLFLDSFKALGASPVGMPFPETYSALQQKVIDGQDNPLPVSVSMKFLEVNKYVTLTAHTYTTGYKVINADLWESLTPEQQKIILEGAALGLQANREANAAFREKTTKDAIDIYKASITELTPEQRDSFKEKVLDTYKKYTVITGLIPENEKYGQWSGKTYYDLVADKIKAYSAQ